MQRSIVRHCYYPLVIAILCVGCKPGTSSSEGPDRAQSTITDLCAQEQFQSLAERADTLVARFRRASVAEGDSKHAADLQYFCAFPQTFNDLRLLFSVNEHEPVGILGDDAQPMIAYFTNLRTIPSDAYYDKFIEIDINGTFVDANIRQGLALYQHLTRNTKAVCSRLRLRSDAEVFSIFLFIFDSPHPEGAVTNMLYRSLQNKIAGEDQHLADLLTRAYEEILARSGYAPNQSQ